MGVSKKKKSQDGELGIGDLNIQKVFYQRMENATPEFKRALKYKKIHSKS